MVERRFRALPSSSFQQECRDEECFEGTQREHADDVPLVLLPESQLLETYLAAGRKTVLADFEALKLTPVELDDVGEHFGNRNVFDPFPSQNTQRDRGRLLKDFVKAG